MASITGKYESNECASSLDTYYPLDTASASIYSTRRDCDKTNSPSKHIYGRRLNELLLMVEFT